MKEGQALYFIAVLPPEPVQKEVTAFKNYFLDKYGVRQALKSPPHITLHPPFLWPVNKEYIIKEVLVRFSGLNKPFTIKLDGFSAFKPRVIYINIEKTPDLENLYEKLEYFLESTWKMNNQLRKSRKFNPHMTVAFRDLSKTQFFESWPEFRDKPYSREFEANQITLLKHNGKFWEVIQSSPLRVI